MTTPTADEQKHAEWNLLLADNEYRLQQIRGLRQDIFWKPWLVIGAMAAGAALFAAGMALAAFLLRH
jgi:hypothetical protein